MTRRSLTRSALATVVCFLSALATAQDRELVIWGMALGPDSKGSDAMIREFERRNPSPVAIEMQRRIRAELEALIKDPTRGLTVYFSCQRRAPR